MLQVRPLRNDDRDWAVRLIEEHWVSAKIVSRGRVHHASDLPGLVATQDDKPVGLVTYRMDVDECEIITMNALEEGAGIGSALLEAVKSKAAHAGCKRLWLVTTNDNLTALRFYQEKGLRIVAVHRNAVEESRRIKPEIPIIGMNGIPIRDEIELELLL